MAEGKNESTVVFLKDKDWSPIDGELCRVDSFSPIGAYVEGGEVRTAGGTLPYAAIAFECSKLDGKATGYITHGLDFQHLWSAFRERTVPENEEVIVL